MRKHTAHAMHTHGLGHVEGANEVALVSFDRVFDRGLHRRHCSQVDHGTATGGGTLNQRGVRHIAFDQLEARVAQLQVVTLAGGKVVEDTYGIALGQQRIAQVRANEAGAAGDQDGASAMAVESIQ